MISQKGDKPMRKLKLALGGLAVLLGLAFLLQGLFWLVLWLPTWVFAAPRGGAAWAVILAALLLIGAGLVWLVSSQPTRVGKAQVTLTTVATLLVQPFPLTTGPILTWRILSDIPEPLRGFVAAPLVMAALLFSDTIRYVVVSAAALFLTLAGLAWLIARERGAIWQRLQFYVLAFAIVPVVAFPLTFSSIPYRPAVEAAPGVEMRLIAQPGWLSRTVRMCRAMAEVERYQYEPLGWADVRTLVYRQWRGGRYGGDSWRSHPGSPGAPLAYHLDDGTVTRFHGSLDTLHRRPCNPAACVEPFLAEVPSYHPGRFEDPLLSPDGGWVAFTAWDLEGPEDLLIVSKAP
jgi:hypothetical protein